MIKKLFLTYCILFGSLQAQNKLVNTKHLDQLYEEFIINKDTIGIIHIYSEYPDYKWVDDADEGIACIDDAARAMIFYLYHHNYTKDPNSLLKTKRLLNFIFYMQAGNGFLYNFIWKDKSINKSFRTSVAEPNWWTWRALWAFSEALKYFINEDAPLANRIRVNIKKILSSALPVLDKKEEYGEFSGLKLPIWLPFETAADQGAIILKALSVYYEVEKDTSVTSIMKKLGNALIKMQSGGVDSPPYFAFLSWQNTWHAWGNSQADALISAGKVLNDSGYINAGINEVKYFYPFLTWKKYYSDFKVEKKNNSAEIISENPFPQIAYGFRPMIFAALNAYEVTKDPYYAELAGIIGSWFLGRNRKGTQMYFPETGICYDGLSADKVNLNSGAESTIEALFSMLKIENNSIANKMLFETLEQE